MSKDIFFLTGLRDKLAAVANSPYAIKRQGFRRPFKSATVGVNNLIQAVSPKQK